MKVFYAFLVICFISSLVISRLKPAWRTLSLLALCALLVIGYYFFNRI